MNQKELFRDNLRDSHWIGEVVDNQDPQSLGRCRIKVYGKFDLLETEDIPWATPSNTQIVGAYSVPNIGDIIAVYFDNGNIYSPVYKNSVVVNNALRDEVISGSANPEAITSLVYDSAKGVRVYHTQEEGFVITTGNGPDNAPALRVSNDGKIYLYANDIFIASGFNDESEPAVKGQTLTEYLDKIVDTIANHVHLSGSGPVDPKHKLDMKFLKAKLDNIKQKS